MKIPTCENKLRLTLKEAFFVIEATHFIIFVGIGDEIWISASTMVLRDIFYDKVVSHQFAGKHI